MDEKPDQDTEELHTEQLHRETEELRKLTESQLPDEAAQHERRAEKSAYLREKLEQRAESERD